jgi:uncharacterized membrane protein YczE
VNPRLLLTRRIVQLLIGLFLYGIAISMMVRAGIGVSPWDVLAQGLSLKSGIPFGLITNIVGLVVLLFWIPLRQRPGLGTVLNVLLIGPAAQLGLWLIPQQTEPWVQVVLFTGGLLLLAVATGLYIGPRLGPGPRDGLMTGLHARTGWPIWSVRTGIEISVLIIGWILGGNVGIGTLAFALLIGPLCSLTLPLFAIRLPQAVTANAVERAPGERAPELERELEGSAEQATQYDLREGLLIEPDVGARARDTRRATSSTIGAHGADRDRATRQADARTIGAYWLDDRLFGSRRPRAGREGLQPLPHS